MDQEDYKKADKSQYVNLAPLLDESGIKQVSLEDAEAVNDLEVLLPLFKKITVILGSIAVARSKIEAFDDLKARIAKALEHIPTDRLILAPDCGLGFLKPDQVKAKLEVMAKVAKEF